MNKSTTVDIEARRPVTGTGKRGRFKFQCPGCGIFCSVGPTLLEGACSMCGTRFDSEGKFSISEPDKKSGEPVITFEVEVAVPEGWMVECGDSPFGEGCGNVWTVDKWPTEEDCPECGGVRGGYRRRSPVW